jgi:uncharacterized protein YecE (DUF72 family)
MDLTTNTLRCGPSGWSFPHWEGVVYPRTHPRGFHPLSFLAGCFDVLEIESTYLEHVKPEVSRVWLRKVEHNPNFRFTARLNRQFTHERQLDAVAIREYKDGLAPLWHAGRLGCVVMQFPWAFRFTPENREHLIRLRRTFAEYPLVAEMRHNSWMTEEAVGVFVDYKIGFGNIDQTEYVRAMPPTAHLTSPVGYVRLYGRSAREWFMNFDDRLAPQGRFDYLYSRQELDAWRPGIERITAHASETYVVLANDAGGRSVVNSLQLHEILGLRTIEAPEPLVDCYAEQLAPLVRRTPRQESLFVEPPPVYTGSRAVA